MSYNLIYLEWFLVIKDNPDKYDDHRGFLTIGYYLKKNLQFPRSTALEASTQTITPPMRSPH
jgi:hypothetical protein